MYSTVTNIHLAGEAPKVKTFGHRSFFAVDVSFSKQIITFFFDTEQELINFKNNFLWAFEHHVNKR